MGLNFKYIVKGDHPIFQRVDRRCLTAGEAKNVKDGLEAVGYEVKIESIKNQNEPIYQTWKYNSQGYSPGRFAE